MPVNKAPHEVHLSGLPRKLAATASSEKSVSLVWDKAALRERILFVLKLLCGRGSTVNLQFVDPNDMGALNWQFRGKTQPTDVLSFLPHESNLFVGSESSRKGLAHHFNLGDVAVCAEVCAEQARRHRCTLAEEIERMIVHGLVHLLGLDHERSPAAFKVMSALEKSIRSELKIEFGAPDFCRIQERPAKAKRGNGRS